MEQQERKKQKKRSLIIAAAGAAVAVLLLIGLTGAWFFQRQDIATMVSIAPPSDIAIRGAHGKTLTALDMSYTDADRDASKKVTIRRVISVSTAADKFQLEIAHTTNSENLTFTLYPATEATDGTIVDGEYKYKFAADKKVNGHYINQKDISNSYKYADDSRHKDNYEDYKDVQAHAEPLYWLADTYTKTEAERADTNGFIYYVLEISWTETEEKETDIFYVLAQNK